MSLDPWAVSPELCDRQVRLGDIDLSTGRDIPTPVGAILSLHTMTGWDDSVEDLADTYRNRMGHGIEPGLEQMAQRQITLQGLILGSSKFGFGSPSDVSDMVKRFRRSTLYVTDKGGLAREASVAVDWQATPLRGAPSKAIYTASLTAHDPLRYTSGRLEVPRGSTLLPNGGTIRAYPILEGNGPAAFTIRHNTQDQELAVAIPAGWHIIDCRRATVWGPNGIAVPGAAKGSWPYVDPGGSEWYLTGFSEVGRLRVRRWEAWR